MKTRQHSGLIQIVALVGLLSSAVTIQAVGPDRSSWQKNLSSDTKEVLRGTEDPEVVVVGNTVHLLENDRALDNYDLRRLIYRRSIDGGATFQASIILEEHAGLEMSPGRMRRMAVDGDTVHIATSRSPVPSGGGWYYEIAYYRSIDNGASFEPRKALSTGVAAYHLKMPHIQAQGGKVAIAYLHYPNWFTDSHAVLIYSSDGGQNFSSKTISRTTLEGYALWDLVQSGDKLAVALVASKGIPGSYSSTSRLLVAASTDNGNSWAVNQVCGTNSAGWPMVDSLADYAEKPDLAWDGDKLYVTWTGLDEKDTRQAFFARSLNNGQSFEAQVNLSGGQSGTPQYGQATLAARAGQIYVIWTVPNKGIWLRTSSNSGQTWETARLISGGWWPLVTIDPESADGRKAHFIASGWYRTTDDGGATLSLPVNLTTAWSWWGSGLKSADWSIGSGSVVHLAYFGVEYPMPGSDYDFYYRRYNPQAPALGMANQCLKLPSDIATYQYENMQVSGSGTLRFTNELTVELWMLAETNCPRNSTLVYQAHPDHYKGAIKLQTHDWANGQRPSGKVLTTNGVVEVWGGEPLDDGQWHHVAMTYDAKAGLNNLRLYVDGHLSATATGMGPINQSVHYEEDMWVGGPAASTYEVFKGSLDDLRFWNRALSEAELRVKTMDRGRTPQPGLVAYFPLDGSTREATGKCRDGVLMYKESFADANRSRVPAFIGPELTTGAVGSPYRFEILADWATSFAIAEGMTPPGLTFDAALGIFSGTPTSVGAYDLTVSARNDFGTATQRVRIVVGESQGLVFRDDFNTTTNSTWEVLRDFNTSAYYWSYNNGLKVRAHWGDLWGNGGSAGNIFTVPAPNGDFTVTLGVSKWAPGENLWAQAFLMAYDDDNNYIRLGYGWASRRALAVIKEEAASPSGTDEGIDFSDKPFLLRLSKSGNIYQAYWSTDGVEFRATGKPMAFGDGTPGKLGFWVGIDPTGTNVAYIDSFEVKADAYPFVTSSKFSGGQVGATFNWQVQGPSGSQYTATGLAPGLVIDPNTGRISGTPSAPGTYEVVVTVSNHNGSTTHDLRLVFEDSDRSFFHDSFNGAAVAGWKLWPANQDYYHFANGSQLWVRANNGDTWQSYNRPLNLFTVAAPSSPYWMVTLGINRFEPTSRNYNSMHVVGWKDTDNNVRLSYGYGDGRNTSISSENNTTMQSFGRSLDAADGPVILRLVREGNSYTGFISTNGVVFEPVSTNSVTLQSAPSEVGFWFGIDPSESNEAWVDFFDVKLFGPTLRAETSGAGLKLSWKAVSGVTYQPESSNDLNNWVGSGAPISGNGQTATIDMPVGIGSRFYRIKAQ